MADESFASSSRGRGGPRGRGRRSQADRERLQREEEQRDVQARHQHAQEQRNQRARGGNVGGAVINRRGRGGPSNPRSEELVTRSVPIGPFSLGSVIDPSRKKTFARNWAPSKQGRTAGARSIGVIRKGRGGRGSRRAIDDDGDDDMLGSDAEDDDRKSIYSSSEGGDDDDGFDLDDDGIQAINVDDFQDEVAAIEEDGSSFFPISLDRKPHVDRRIQISAEASETAIKKEEDIAWNFRGNGRRAELEIMSETHFQPVFSDDEDEDGVYIKPDPVAKENVDDEDIEEAEDGEDPKLVHSRTSSTKSRLNLTKSRSTTSEMPTNFQTDEDRKEWERWQNDQDHISQFLGGYIENLGFDEEEKAKKAEEIVKAREGMAVLMQLPPVLSRLYDQTEQAADTNEDTAHQGLRLEPGCVGKLRIHKSGKAHLDWGGIKLDLKNGLSSGHYQNAVYVPHQAGTDSNPVDLDKDSGHEQNQPISAISLGTVKERFVVTPNFDAMMNRR